MIGRALDAGVRAQWVAGDEVYGADPSLGKNLEKRGVGYVLAIGCERRVSTPAGVLRADDVATRLPKHVWQRLSAGAGAKGHRYYDWAFADIDTDEPDGCRWLLIRRHRATGELAFYRCYAPEPVPLRILVHVAGRRWTVEESFQTSKGLTGLDQHQVRRWTSWHRWTVMAMLAHAFLAVIRIHRTKPRTGNRRTDLVDLQRNPPPVHHTHQPTRSRCRTPDPLLDMAQTPPIPRPARPLPATNDPQTMTITN